VMPVSRQAGSLASTASRNLSWPWRVSVSKIVFSRVKSAQPPFYLRPLKAVTTQNVPATPQDVVNARFESAVTVKKAIRQFPACSFEEAIICASG
jgi:hypothetical protein